MPTFDLYLNGTTTQLDSTLNTRVDADVDLDKERLYAVSNSAAVGSGTAIARMHSSYNIPETTEYTVSVDYHRDVDVLASSGELYVYTKDDLTGLRKFKLEDLGPSGDTTRSATFEMNENRTYEIGIELRAYSSTAGAAAYTDAYNCKSIGCFDGRHHVEMNREPILKW